MPRSGWTCGGLAPFGTVTRSRATEPRSRSSRTRWLLPFGEAEFDIIYGLGISKEGDLLDLGVNQGLIEKSGAWYSIQGERMGQGRDNARQFLKEHGDVQTRLEEALRQTLQIPAASSTGNGRPAAAEPTPSRSTPGRS